MNVIAIANLKGGVYKTATTINLGAALAETGSRVLLVDMDPSGDLTAHAGADLEDGDATVYEVLAEGVPAMEAVRHIHRDGTGTDYDLLPADVALADLTEEHRLRLRDILQDLAKQYDCVLIDTPPSMGLPVVTALTAARHIIVPAMPSILSLTAVNSLSQTVQDMHAAGLTDNLEIAGVVLTDYRPRSVHHREVAGAFQEALPGRVFNTTISNAVAAVEAAAEGTDLFDYVAVTPRRRKTRLLQQYRDLAAEIIGMEAA